MVLRFQSQRTARVCGCAQPIEKTHCGQARGVPLCLGTLPDTPHALHRARGTQPALLMGFSVSLISCFACFFFKTSPPGLPRFFSMLWDQSTLPPPPPSSHLMHGLVFPSAPLSHRPSPQKQLQGSLPEELRENSFKASPIQ